MLERVVELATRALEAFPHNGEILRRRAFARCRILTESLDQPCLEEAEADLRELLAFEPNNLLGELDLLGELFTSSGLEDAKVAEIADAIAERAQATMLSARTLQIHALIDADREEEARDLAATWTRLFPDDEELAAAIP